MKYTDRLYGTIKITEPVILDIIKCKALQRLKGVDQAGYFDVYIPNTHHTRFEHSLGVYILLKNYGAPLQEQIAGLIHDVSHSAFSHCIDYVFGVEKQKTHLHQDNMFSDFVLKSDIPNMLHSYNIDITYILNEHHFPLKEKELPDLCADRIDYSLRTAIIYKAISKKDLHYFLHHLKTIKTQWVFDTYTSAQTYASLFRTLNNNFYSGLPSVTMFYTVGQYVKYALEKGYTNWTSLYTTDKKVISQINKHLSSDRQLQQLWKRMNNKVKVLNDPDNYESKVYVKSRLVDPLFLEQGKIMRVSDKNRKWKRIIETESKPKEYFLRFINEDQ